MSHQNACDTDLDSLPYTAFLPRMDEGLEERIKERQCYSGRKEESWLDFLPRYWSAIFQRFRLRAWVYLYVCMCLCMREREWEGSFKVDKFKVLRLYKAYRALT